MAFIPACIISGILEGAPHHCLQSGDKTTLTLPGGIHMAFSGVGVYYPGGEHTPQRVGIQPDIYVTNSLQGFREGRDEVLERALECVRGERREERGERREEW